MNLKYPKIYPRYDLSDFQNWLQLGYRRKSHESHNLGDFFGYSMFEEKLPEFTLFMIFMIWIDESEMSGNSAYRLVLLEILILFILSTLFPRSKEYSI